MDDHLEWINLPGAAQANADAKIAALADARIRAEDEMAELRRMMGMLSERRAETGARLDRLAELVERYVAGGGGAGARGRDAPARP